MAVYIFYLVLAGIQSYYANKKGILQSAKGKKWYLSLCCIELILLAGLRGYSVGADTKVYLSALEYYSSLPRKEILSAELVKPFVFEKGYFLLTKISAWLGLSKTTFLFIIAVLIYIPVFISIYHYSNAPYISILAYFALGFFSYSLGIFRQMIATSVVLCGINYIPQKKLVKYALCVVVASMFHTTAVATILIYIVYHIPIKKYVNWILPMEIFCLVFGRKIVLFLVEIFPRYSNYVGGQYDVQSGTYLMLVLLNILLFASVYLHNRGCLENRLTISALSIAVMVQAVGYSMALLGRAVGFFSYFSIFVFSDVVYAMTNMPCSAWVPSFVPCDVSNRIMSLENKYRNSIRFVVWTFFNLSLCLLILKYLMGNEYILHYYFYFVE